MPKQHISAEKMGVGKKNGGKHWTRAEVEARQAAAEGVKRNKRVSLRAPKWLSVEAHKIWGKVRKKTYGLELLDNLDADMLAIYCDAVVKYRQASEKLATDDVDFDRDEAIKAIQAWARLVAMYSEKLGFTPAARARLVKHKADETLDAFGEEFDG